MNEGSDAAPKFTGKNIQVMAGDKPFALAAKMTTPRLVDWDGDGDLDLIAGTFGNCWGHEGIGGGVYLSRNNGAKGRPAFGTLVPLIPPSPKGGTEPTRPDAGLYADAVDYDGDGDLDLVVGGYSMWKPKGRELSEKEQATVANLRKELKVVRAQQSKLWEKIRAEAAKASAGMERSSKEARAKTSEIYRKYRDQTSVFGKQVRALMQKLNKLVPGPQRQAFVWLYERLPTL